MRPRINNLPATCPTADYESAGIDITAVTKLKHADLWAAAKKLGSQAALARHLGIQQTEVGEWINLKRCPPAEPVGERWTEDYLTEIEGKLLALTGKAWDELFPPELRENSEFLDCEKTIEQTARVRAYAMKQYALATRERLERIGHGVGDGQNERREAINAMLETLPDREREIIRLRYGIDQPDGRRYTLREIGRTMDLSGDRIMQLERRALRKLTNVMKPHAEQLLLMPTCED